MLAQLQKGAFFHQKAIKKLVNGDIPNALHKLPVVEEIRYKRSVGVPDTPNKHEREKRGLIGIALPIIGKLATIAIEALESHLQKKRKRAMAKALGRMESSQLLTKNQFYKLDNDFLMFKLLMG